MDTSKAAAGADVIDLVETHWRRIHKLCLFYLRDPQDAEEATQQAFENILRKYSQFQGRSASFTWIYRVAVNAALDRLRRRRIVRWFGLDQAGEPRAPGTADPAVEMERQEEEREKLDRLQAGIARMSVREKKAFYLFHYEQLPQREIAAIMSVSVPAVESLVHKAVNKIRKT
jgi:RNA polymerase sigma-70 factor (ECF subfamily)